jgi:hypothetical protein
MLISARWRGEADQRGSEGKCGVAEVGFAGSAEERDVIAFACEQATPEGRARVIVGCQKRSGEKGARSN